MDKRRIAKTDVRSIEDPVDASQADPEFRIAHLENQLAAAKRALDLSRRESQARSEALARANDDLNDLLRSNEVATIFLDEQMKVRQFTPGISRIYNMRSLDLGRSIFELTNRALDMPPLPSPQDVYARKDPSEVMVRMKNGACYVRRALPYRDQAGMPQGIVVTFNDVTQQRQNESRLRERAADLRRVIDHMLGFVGVLDKDGTLTEANQTALAVGGVTREDVIGKKFWECYWWNYNDEVMERLKRSITQAAKGAIVRYDVPVRTADGTLITIDFMLVPVQDEAGHVTQLIPSGLDISDRKRAERVLADRAKMSELHANLALSLARDASLDEILQQCCQCLVDHLGVALARIWLVDETRAELSVRASAGMKENSEEDGSIPTCNRVIQRIATERVPLKTNNAQQATSFEYSEWARRAGIKAFAGYPLLVEGRVVGVMAFFSRNEVPRDTLNQLRPLADAIAQFVRRKEVQRDLEIQHEHIQLITNTLPALIAYIDAEQRYEFVNRHYAEQFGLDQKEVLGKTVREVLGAENYRRAEPQLAAAMQGTSQQYELQLEVPSSRTIQTKEVSYVPQRAADGSVLGCHCLIIDTTERRAIEEELHQSRIAAEAASVSKSEFLANMSHEIRTPMSAILGYAELLSRHVSDPDDLQCVETIRRNGHFLLEIINDILDLSRIEAGKLDLDLQRIQIASMLADVKTLMEVRAKEKGLPLDIHFRSRVPETIETDAVRLRQILVNLVGNAIKFTESGHVKMEVELLSAENKMQFDIVDTGIGISVKQQGKLFQPFSQADSSVTREFGGSGLGLSISRRLAEMLGGDITVASQLGVGSTFTLTIDIGDISSISLIKPHEQAVPLPIESPPTKKLACRVLVVDDRRDVRYLAQHFLEEAGAIVDTANDGLEALDKLASGTPDFDLVLLDMQMPKLDGYQCATRLRASAFDKPIIALTANAMKGDREKCLAAGCDDYVAKPIDGGKLVAKVSRYTTESTTPRRANAQPSRLLIVDDSEHVCRMMKMLLESPLRHVQTASTGEAAILAARDSRPDIVLLDLSLPDISGFDVAQRLREMDETKTCTLVAVSGLVGTEERNQAATVGFDHYLVKPVDSKELEELVSQYIQ